MLHTPKVSAVLITREKQWPADAMPDFPFDEVLITTECKSLAHRFELAREARNEVIYFQDDDCAVNIHKLWSRYDGRLTYAIPSGHKAMYDQLCLSKVCLIGWGCFTPKELTDTARWKPYRDLFGEVPAHEVDRAFTYFARPHNPVIMPTHYLHREQAMSRDNPQHYVSRGEMILRLLECK